MGMPGHDWRKLAACRGQDPNIYVPEKKDKKDTKHYDKSICQGCVVRQECLDYALANRATKGLWGGTTPKEREKLYPLYKGERTYELDLQRILFPPKSDSRDLIVEDSPAPAPDTIVCDTMAPDAPVYFSWVKEIFTQGTLFPIEEL